MDIKILLTGYGTERVLFLFLLMAKCPISCMVLAYVLYPSKVPSQKEVLLNIKPHMI